MANFEQIIIKNKAFGIAQESGGYGLYRLMRNSLGEVMCYSQIGFYQKLSDAIYKLVQQVENK